MTSTGYEPLRRPGGDRSPSNGGTRSSGKTLHKVSQPGSSGSLESEVFEISDVCKKTRPNGKKPNAVMPQADDPPAVFHPATPCSSRRVRKSSPLASLDSAQFSDMVRNVRQRPTHSTPYDLLHIDPHAEYLSVDKHQTT